MAADFNIGHNCSRYTDGFLVVDVVVYKYGPGIGPSIQGHIIIVLE